MNANAQPPGRAKVIRLIHLGLTMGVVLMAVTIAAMRISGSAPEPSMSSTTALGITGAGVLAIAISLAVLRPRVGQRDSAESVDDFWSGPPTQAALIAWAVIEAGGLLGVVGYMLSGAWAPLGLAVVSILGLVFTRPGTFE
jgi:hypothetical protein